MMKPFVRRLCLKRGEAYLDTIISIFVIMIVIAMALTLFPVFMQKYQLDMAAEDIARMISVSGQTSAIDVEAISADYNIELDDVTITIDDTARTALLPDGSGRKIQLSDGFKVTLTTHRTVGVGGVVSEIDIPLTSVARGRSEVYWKELATTP